MTRKMLILTVCMAAVLSFYIGAVSSQTHNEDFGQRRGRVLNEVSLAIDDAVSEGRYECCIDPPCTMCYMGDWLWDDGICRCDEMMARGEMDKVCPQCIKGVEEGRCRSVDGNACLTGGF